MIGDVTRDEAELMLKMVQGYVNAKVYVDVALHQDCGHSLEIRNDDRPLWSMPKEKLNE